MSDPTDLPAKGSETASGPTESVPPQVTVTAFAGVAVSVTTTADPTATQAEPQTYQPLSMLAVVALGIAAIYTAVVVLGGVFAMLNRTPWLLPVWSILFPLLAAGAAYIARFHIRRSEGALSGMPLTSWAVGLSVGVGLIYTMYYAGTFFAVRSQSQAFAETWMRKIAEGKIEEAFHETTKPPRKIVGTLRQTLEIMHNVAAPTGPGPGDPTQRGPYTLFTTAEYVRLIQLAGPKAKFEATGVKDWEYEKGGYSVTLTYRVTTDLASFPMQVKLHGSESPSREYTGRQWHVIFDETGVIGPSAIEYTPEGKELRLQAQVAGSVAADWIEAISRNNTQKVYADTLNAADRKEAAALYRKNLLVGFAVGPLPPSDEGSQKYLEARQKFLTGGLIRIDEGVFWTDPALKPMVEAEAKALFDLTKNKQRSIALLATLLPLVTRDDNRLRIGIDMQVVVRPDEAGAPPLIIDGRLIVGADKANLTEGKANPEAWRIEAVELVRGRNAAMPGGAAGGPGRGPPPRRG